MLKTRPSRALAKPCLEVSLTTDPITLTFSQPMIPIGSRDTPVLTLDPPVPATWIWRDRCTLVLDTELPRATRYRLALPQGARSLDGRELGTREWEVSLAGPAVVGVVPSTRARLELQPTLRLSFDQKIDPEALLPLVRLRVGRRRYPLQAVERATPCELAFRPTTPLPKDARVVLELPAGLPSLEGPERSEKARRFDFRTVAPLRMLRRGLLEWLASPAASEPLRIRFNNPLKAHTAKVRLEPDIPVMVTVFGHELLVSGAREAGQAYRVQVDPGLTDIYGQQLGRSERRSFRPSWARPHLSLPAQMVAVRPGEKVPIFTAGLKRVSCNLKSVDPDQFEDYFMGRPVKARAVKSWTQPVPNWSRPETSWLEVGPDVGHRLLEVTAGHLVAVLWLQVTELNLHAQAYPEGLSVVVTGPGERPREGASVVWGTSKGRTGWDGHCLLERPGRALQVSARLGHDSALLLLPPTGNRELETIRWCVFDDRGLYRPGEKARLKGWLRRSTGGIPSGLLEYRLSTEKGEQAGQVALSAQGGFDLELTLECSGCLELKLDGSTHCHFLRVEEFRRPEFELSLDGLHVSAAYHSGGALGGAPLRWAHQLTERACTPPGWEAFFRSSHRNPIGFESGDANLDDHGLLELPGPTHRPRPGTTLEVDTTVEVVDVNRQVVSSKSSLLIPSSEPMVGMRRSAAGVEVIVVSPDGRPLPGHEVLLDDGRVILSQTAPINVGAARTASVGDHLALLSSRRGRLRLPEEPVFPGDEVAIPIESGESYRLGVLRSWVGPRRLQARVFRPGDEVRLKVPEGGVASMELHLALLLPDGHWQTESHVLPISLETRRLQVKVAAEPAVIRPGGVARLELEVRDHRGQPVPNAEVALFGADEAVLQAASYQEPDLLAAFYPALRSGSSGQSLDAWFPRAEPPVLHAGHVCGRSGVVDSLMMISGPKLTCAVALRSDLRPLAFFHPALRTDGEGRVRLEETLPDSLTRFRIIALVTSGGNCGSAHTTVTTRLPLSVRPWLPRFLHRGDRFDFCLGVQNLTDEERDVDVEVLVSGLTFLEGVERHCRLKPGARAEVRLPCRAWQSGPVTGLARVVSGEHEDACRVQLEVKEPILAERVTHQGREARRLPVSVPPDADPTFGGLELVESDTPLPLTYDAYLQLRNYRMSCSEQLSSRLLGWVLGGPHWAPESWRGHAADIVPKLFERQQADGQFRLFPGYSCELPFVSAHAAQALLRAYMAGVELDLQKLSRGMDYLASLAEVSPLEQAYALNVLSQVGRGNPERVEELAGHRRLTTEGMAFLLPLARGRTRARLREKLLAGLPDGPGPQGLFSASRRPAALAWLALGPESGQLERLLEPNPWGSTQDHAFTLLALSENGRGQVRERSWKLSELGPAVELAGESFFRATLTTRPLEMRREAINEGFGVTRSYELGDVVKIKLTLSLAHSHTMVGLIDPLPAGLELLPGSQQPPVWSAIHSDYRDDCTELAWARLERGRHQVTLLARATTPGTFLAPGTRVEEMYRPQIFGLGEAQELRL